MSLAITEGTGGSDVVQLPNDVQTRRRRRDKKKTEIFIANGDVADINLVFGKWEPLRSGRQAMWTTLVVEKGTAGPARVGRKEKARASGVIEAASLRIVESRSNF